MIWGESLVLVIVERYNKLFVVYETSLPIKTTKKDEICYMLQKLSFKDNETAEMVDFKLKSIPTRTYPATKLVSLYQTKCSLWQSNVGIYPSYLTSNYVYHFRYTCQSTYIGRTERSVCVRFFEHSPQLLKLNR